MASRRLALNLSRGLRNRAAIKAPSPLVRGFATPIHGSKTQTTNLKNGFTVRFPRFPLAIACTRQCVEGIQLTPGSNYQTNIYTFCTGRY